VLIDGVHEGSVEIEKKGGIFRGSFFEGLLPWFLEHASFWMNLRACRQGGKAPREWHTGRRISSLSRLAFHAFNRCHVAAGGKSGFRHRAAIFQSNLRFTAADARAYSSFQCSSPSAFTMKAIQSSR
jgi:hypothetical protein